MAEVLNDHKLASLGDAHVNFACSLALSNRTGRSTGTNVKGSVLAKALRKAGLRECLPSRMTRHKLADAAEALIVYAWINDCVSLEETVALIREKQGTR